MFEKNLTKSAHWTPFGAEEYHQAYIHIPASAYIPVESVKDADSPLFRKPLVTYFLDLFTTSRFLLQEYTSHEHNIEDPFLN